MPILPPHPNKNGRSRGGGVFLRGISPSGIDTLMFNVYTIIMATVSSQPDYSSAAYWNGIIRMSLSKFFILCVLNERDLHGYDIAKQVIQRTEGCCAPTEGTIYPVLAQFSEGGYVKFRTELVSGRERKTYSITQKGRNAFAVALAEWMKVTKCLDACAGDESTCC